MTDYDLDEVVAVSRGDLKKLAGWDEHLMLDSTQEKAIPVSDDHERLLAAVERYGSFRIDYTPATGFNRATNRLPHATISFGTELCVYQVVNGSLEVTLHAALDSLERLQEIDNDH